MVKSVLEKIKHREEDRDKEGQRQAVLLSSQEGLGQRPEDDGAPLPHISPKATPCLLRLRSYREAIKAHVVSGRDREQSYM